MSATRRSSLSTAAGLAKSAAAGSKSATRLVGTQVVESLLEPPRVGLLGAREGLEPLRAFREALFPRRSREAGVHLRVLVRLALDGGLEVRIRVAHRETRRGVAHFLEEIEVSEGVPGLRLCRVAE